MFATLRYAHLDDKVADGRDHHQPTPLEDLGATSHTRFEKGLHEGESRGQLAPSEWRTGRAFVHGQTSLLVDVNTAAPSCEEPASMYRT